MTQHGGFAVGVPHSVLCCVTLQSKCRALWKAWHWDVPAMWAAGAEQMLGLLLVGGCATSCSCRGGSGLLETRRKHRVTQNLCGGKNHLQHEVICLEIFIAILKIQKIPILKPK